MTSSGKAAVRFASMSTCSDMFSEVAETQPSVGVEQLLEIMQAFLIVVEELERHSHGIAGVQLAQVADMHLGGEAGMPAGLRT